MTSSIAKIHRELIGCTKEGKTVERFTLQNGSNTMEVQILTYGAIISKLLIPDKHGKLSDVVLGFDNVEGYENQSLYIGGIIGRVANRIANGQFTLDGETYKLQINNGPNTNHGGFRSYDKVHWEPSVKDSKLCLTYISPSGENGFPGQVRIQVFYELTDDNTLVVTYEATTTKATPINLTNHAYFNLAGQECGHLSDHLLTVPTDNYLPVDENCLVTGEIKSVANGPMDLRTEVKLGERLEKVSGGNGYDHTYCFGQSGKKKLMARLSHPESGRELEVWSTQPGIQIYTGFFLDGPVGKNGSVYKQYSGMCLETQHYPNSINMPQFPSTVLEPGTTFQETTWFKFGITSAKI